MCEPTIDTRSKVYDHLLPLGSDDTTATNMCRQLPLGRQSSVVVAGHVLALWSASDISLKIISDTHHISGIDNSKSCMITKIPRKALRCVLTD